MADILVVDDQPANREFLVTLLGYFGHRVREAATGLEALARVAEAPPQLVISDVVMPGVDGIDLARRLAQRTGRRIPLIFYTASFREGEARSFASDGTAAAVLVKPSDPHTIISTVDEALRGAGAATPTPAPIPAPAAGGEEAPVTGILERKLRALESMGSRFAALVEYGIDLAGERDPACLLEKLCIAAFATIGCALAAATIDGGARGGGRRYLCLSSGGPGGPACALDFPPPPAEALAALIGRRPVRIAAHAGDAALLGLGAAHPRVRSLLGVPIEVRGEVVGWLYLADRRGDVAFGDEDERIATLLAAQGAAAYESIARLEDLGRRAAELEAEVLERRRAESEVQDRERLAAMTADVAFALTADAGLGEILRRCAEAIAARLDLAVARIWTVDEKDPVLVLHASAGSPSLPEEPFRRLPFGAGLVGAVAAARRPLVLEDLHASPLALRPDLLRPEGLVAFAGQPLLVGEELLGVIGVFAGRPLTATRVAAIAAVADAIALGVKRKLVEERQGGLENQLRQAQKMEAVGRLAGGIAHDFNNLLAAITGYSDIVLWGIAERDPVRKDVEEIRNAALRAAGLTRQLLIFSRQQKVATRILDLNAIVGGMEKLLQRLIGEDVALEVDLARGLGAVSADAGHLEQVIMNLAVNARDAMPKGGGIRIETRDVVVDAALAGRHADARIGGYARLSVTDTGTGMTAEVLSHLFEPFFTTKEVGKGTGLGLSTVFGIVKQCGGFISVESEVGRGSTFRIHLPHASVDGGVAGPSTGHAGPPPRGRQETILLVEDDDTLRELARRVLKTFGYRVIAARSGREALDKAPPSETVDMLLTDVVMPGMDGKELATRLREARPGVRVLYMSGYTGGVALAAAQAEGRLLEKPFTPESIARRVREVLDAPA